MVGIDLRVELAGIIFKNPVLPAASELVFDAQSARRIANQGVGGIVTKTFTTSPEFRIRVKPFQFPLAPFSELFRKSGSFYSLASPHVEDLDVVIKKNIPEISNICKQSSLPLIVSFFEKPHDPYSWKRVAKDLEKAGADILEINFSSPTMRGELERGLRGSFKIIESIEKSSNIPFGVKISPMMEPLVEAVKGWKKRGVSFVTAHNAPSGIYIDVESETPYGAPMIGGYLVGRPFLPISLARVIRILKEIEIPIIGAGGVFNGNDALQYLLCGASLVQIATAAYVEGLGIFEKIIQEIYFWMKRKKYKTVSEFKGKILPQIDQPLKLKMKEKFPFVLPPQSPYFPNINHKKCIRCQACYKSCIYEALYEVDGKIKVKKDLCWSCGFCVGICPEKAITLIDRKTKRCIWNGSGLAQPFK